MLRILAALDPFYDQITPSGRNSARRLRALVLVLRYSGMRIGDAVKLTTDKLTGSKLFLYTQKTGVPVYTVLPDFVVRALDVIPRVTPTHFFMEWYGHSGWSRWKLARKTTRTVPACKSDSKARSKVQRYFCR